MAASTVEFEVPDSIARTQDGLSRTAGDALGEKMIINMGPSHPATHGVLRLILEMDGEYITKATPEVGYLHRGDEKIAENMTYNQFVPYTDRLDYLAPVANNIAYALAVEKLMGWELPPRGQAIRVLCCELARISAHLLGLGCFAMDTGAMTVFLYTFQQREIVYNLMEQITGARFTTSYTRIGGMVRDLTPEIITAVRKFCEGVLPVVDETDKLLTRNRIFVDRTKDIGTITKADAISYGLSGPNLRACGVDHDLRKRQPYCGYEQYEFDVPIGSVGDSYDRYLMRMEEIKQSVRILRQVCDTLPGGAWYVNDPKNYPPPKTTVLTKMEELIHHFIIHTEGLKAPEGEVYFGAENPKGELGFYIYSKGGGTPYRLKIRSPSFINLSILPKILPGHMMSDVVSILGSLDFVMGECDR